MTLDFQPEVILVLTIQRELSNFAAEHGVTTNALIRYV